MLHLAGAHCDLPEQGTPGSVCLFRCLQEPAYPEEHHP